MIASRARAAAFLSLALITGAYTAGAADITRLPAPMVNGMAPGTLAKADANGRLSQQGATAADVTTLLNLGTGPVRTVLLSHVANNTAAAKLDPSLVSYFVKDGYSAAGDGGSLAYSTTTTTCPISNGLGDGASQVALYAAGSTPIGCAYADFGVAVPSAKAFGALADGNHDDTANLNAFGSWLNSVGRVGRLPAGTYNFTAQLLPLGPSPSNSSSSGWRGDGKGVTVLNYTGSSATIDLVSIPCTSNAQCGKTALDDLSIRSTTQMTGGAALHAVWTTFVDWKNVELGQINLRSTLYHGLWLDNAKFATLTGFDSQAKADCLRMNDVISGVFQNFRTLGMTCDVGIHLGGGNGGIQFGYVDQYGARIGMLVDNAIDANAANTQIFTTGETAFDTNTQAAIYLNDTVAGDGKTFQFQGWAASTHSGNGGSTAGAGAGSGAIVIAAWKGGTFAVGGGSSITYNDGSGIVDVDQTATLLIDQAANISANGKAGNGGFGVNCGVSTPRLYSSFVAPSGSNPSGDFSSACGAGQVTGAAWPSYSPAFQTAGSTSYTVNSASYRTVGKTTTVALDFTVASLGDSPSNTPTITLPTASVGGVSATARDSSTGQREVFCSGTSGGTAMGCTFSAAPAANDRYAMSFTYQSP